MKLAGTQDNILVSDENMRGMALNFSKGLSISGDTAFITLKNHFISEFNVTLRFSVVELQSVRSNYKDIYLETGLVNDVIHPDEQVVQIRAR